VSMGVSRSEVELPVKSHREGLLRDWMERDKLVAASSADGLA